MLLQVINNAEGIQALVQSSNYAIANLEPFTQQIDQATISLADKLGLTQVLVDQGDSSLYKAMDLDAVKTRLISLTDGQDG